MALKLPLEKQAIPGRSVDIELIRELATLLDETGLTEIEVGEGDHRVRVARMAGPQAAVAPLPASAPVTTPAQAAPTAPAAAVEADASHPGAVTSPMVGACYHAPEPGAAPFVKVGDTVSEGDTLFIIEAMKTMNPIRAPRAGRVAKVLVENGAPVEYGEVLLILE
jgi:acetyl-CoA carboxylase biotin carboxyl carrier protein